MSLLLFNAINNELNLPSNLRVSALELYKDCIAKGLTKGRKGELVINACIYLSSQINSYPIKLKELREPKSDLFRTVKFIKRFIDIKNCINPGSYISRYCYELGLCEADKTCALENLKIVSSMLINKSSQSIAAVSVYLTGRTSIRSLALVSGLSNSHVYNCVKLVVNKLP